MTKATRVTPATKDTRAAMRRKRHAGINAFRITIDRESEESLRDPYGEIGLHDHRTRCSHFPEAHARDFYRGLTTDTEVHGKLRIGRTPETGYAFHGSYLRCSDGGIPARLRCFRCGFRHTAGSRILESTPLGEPGV